MSVQFSWPVSLRTATACQVKGLLPADKHAAWEAKCYTLGLSQLKALAKELGAGEPYFDWEKVRATTRLEGRSRICTCNMRANQLEMRKY